MPIRRGFVDVRRNKCFRFFMLCRSFYVPASLFVGVCVCVRGLSYFVGNYSTYCVQLYMLFALQFFLFVLYMQSCLRQAEGPLIVYIVVLFLRGRV